MTQASNNGKHVAMTRCYFCGEGSDILLHKKLGDVSQYHNKVVSMEPCSKCQGYMRQGIILIAIDGAKSDPDWHKPKPVTVHGKYGREETHPGMPNPFRTGGFFVITEEAFKRIFTGEGVQEFGLKMRFMFIEQEAVDKLGFVAVTQTEKKDE